MTTVNPEPANTTKVEPKVAVGTVVTYIVSLLALALVNGLTANQNELLFAALPDAVETIVLPLIPALSTLVAGYYARHQWRVVPGATGGGRSTTVG